MIQGMGLRAASPTPWSAVLGVCVCREQLLANSGARLYDVVPGGSIPIVSVSGPGRDVPKPVMTFEESPFPDYVLDEVRKAGFKGPTPIQSQGWPMALSGTPPPRYADTNWGRCRRAAVWP